MMIVHFILIPISPPLLNVDRNLRRFISVRLSLLFCQILDRRTFVLISYTCILKWHNKLLFRNSLELWKYFFVVILSKYSITRWIVHKYFLNSIFTALIYVRNNKFFMFEAHQCHSCLSADCYKKKVNSLLLMQNCVSLWCIIDADA